MIDHIIPPLNKGNVESAIDETLDILAVAQDRLEKIKAAREQVYNQYLKDLDQEIRQSEKDYNELRERLRASVHAYTLATNDRKPHSDISPYTSSKIVYDENQAVKWCQEQGLDNCLKVSLKKSVFKAYLSEYDKDNHDVEEQIELIVPIPQKLGARAIEVEYEQSVD